jgi:hypothetical protein
LKLAVWLIPFLLAGVPLEAKSKSSAVASVLTIPRVSEPPTLEDFIDMKPSQAWEGRLAKVRGFIQRLPTDGAPTTQRTEAYVGYDQKNLYCIFIAFDSEPSKVRDHKTPRDNLYGDERLDLFLDTYHDFRRAYVFTVNPSGYQMDGLWTEGLRTQYDRSFDTVWHSRGLVTDRGFLVWMAIPFKSLRFPAAPEQTWGIAFIRWIPRVNESATWPRISTRIEGRLNQEATLEGLKDIFPGRNVQTIPYVSMRSYRALDQRDLDKPYFISKDAKPEAGVDAKVILKENSALDATVNPDFSQVESDEPQVTINRRFEAFFPEKRPFFLENPSYFDTPINLVFTRRIIDPQFGVRLTGKQGPYAVGALLTDDQSPGEIVPPDDPLAGHRAYFGIVRISRDILKQSSIGFIYTDREFKGTTNRVGGADARFKLNKNWWASGQAVTSTATFTDGRQLAGPAYKVQLRRDGRQFYYNLDYNDRSPGFFTQTGFIAEETVDRPTNLGRIILRPPLRTDIRSVSQMATYRFRPEGQFLISWGPNAFVNPIWDHRGARLDLFGDYSMSWEFTGQTALELFYVTDQELLRPQDFQGLPSNCLYPHHRQGIYFETSFVNLLTLKSEYSQGTQINIGPPQGQQPFLADLTRGYVSLALRPARSLRVENTYLLERLTDRSNGVSVFNNHILRSRWGWQFNRQLSLRMILQYNAILANPAFTSLETSKNFNADFLFTYLVNPFTALYVGYNSNATNEELLPGDSGNQLVRTQDLLNDSKQFFVKFSYFVRF